MEHKIVLLRHYLDIITDAFAERALDCMMEKYVATEH